MPKKRKTNYLNNKDLLEQVRLSKEAGKMTDELAKMLMLLTQRYATSWNLVKYTYREDMESFALTALVNTWHKFDPDRSSQAFSFYTQCIKNSFRYYLKAEKAHRNLRDELLIKNGLNPSNTYMSEYEEKQHAKSEDGFPTYAHDKPQESDKTEKSQLYE